jgi:tagatose 1,6-diphosphate aldolase
MRFDFLTPGTLTDGQLQLHLLTTESADVSIWHAPTYRFEIQLAGSAEPIGRINLRIGVSDLLTRYVGHIGYSIDEPHRGHHYAERACRLLLPFAARHGMGTIWITCGPDNPASRRTLERLGAEFVEIVGVPDDYPLPEGAVRQKCRYRIEGETMNSK